MRRLYIDFDGVVMDTIPALYSMLEKEGVDLNDEDQKRKAFASYDFGLIITCAIIYYIYKLVKKSKFTYKYYILLICAYLYLQFDSYAFYTIWLMIFLLDNNYINHKEKFVLEKQGEKNEDSTN